MERPREEGEGIASHEQVCNGTVPSRDDGEIPKECKESPVEDFVLANGTNIMQGNLDTGPSCHQGADENVRPKRKRISAGVRPILEDAFKSNPSPELEDRRRLADLGGITLEQVTTWFRNKKSQAKRPRQTEGNGGLGQSVIQQTHSEISTKSTILEVLNSAPGSVNDANTVIRDGGSVSSSNLLAKQQNSSVELPADAESRAAFLEQCSSEMRSLLSFYHREEPLDLQRFTVDVVTGTNVLLRRTVAALVEESMQPFSTLVEEVYNSIRAGTAFSTVTLASIRSTVLSIAERVSHGAPDAANENADVLEDCTPECLWRWQVRDVKLLPDDTCVEVNARRSRRQKIAARLTALSGMMLALQGLDTATMASAAQALAQTQTEDEIQTSSEKLHHNQVKLASQLESKQQQQKLGTCSKEARGAEKERLRKIKEEKEREKAAKEAEKLVKEAEKAAKECEKERLRVEKETIRLEKEAKRQREEVEKELRKTERLEAERKKLESEKKKQLSLKKQANLLDRFLIHGSNQSGQDRGCCSPTAASPSPGGISPAGGERKGVKRGSGLFLPPQPTSDATLPNVLQLAKTDAIDAELAQAIDWNVPDLLRSHVDSWLKIRQAVANRKSSRWGMRRLPKTKEVKGFGVGSLSSKFGVADAKRDAWKIPASEFDGLIVSLDDETGDADERMIDQPVEEKEVATGLSTGQGRPRWKLFQFHENHRPAYYGSFSKRSKVITGRHPFEQDPTLDYEAESDDEWEEEEPGESLSDLDDKGDEEDEEDKLCRLDDEDSNDGFVVPDGYLSEDEGVNLDDEDWEVSSPFTAAEPAADGKDVQMSVDDMQHMRTMEKFRCHLEAATEHALKVQRPLIISALSTHDGTSSIQLTKHELAFMQALSIQVLSPDVFIEVPSVGVEVEGGAAEHEKDEKTAVGRGRPSRNVPEHLVLDIVRFLACSTHGLKRNVEELAALYPTVAKKQLDLKIREVSEFAEGRWQVKKEVLVSLGIELPPCSTTPVPAAHLKTPTSRVKPITKFFTKRSPPLLEESEISPTSMTMDSAGNMQGGNVPEENTACNAG